MQAEELSILNYGDFNNLVENLYSRFKTSPAFEKLKDVKKLIFKHQ